MTENREPQSEPNHAVLKWIVGVLGALIVLFVVVIGVTIFQRLTATDTTTSETSRPLAEPATTETHLAELGDIKVSIPADMEIIDLSASNDRLFLILGADGMTQRILVISLSDGSVLGTLNLDKDGK
ncbi:hypothetical protein [Sneathiella sp.]|uniref:hypothetical protein n=1 Tax=Sneathiella sp. TaxID=1964365 RepID=UPI003567C033